jgi:hypothetical protein
MIEPIRIGRASDGSWSRKIGTWMWTRPAEPPSRRAASGRAALKGPTGDRARSHGRRIGGRLRDGWRPRTGFGRRYRPLRGSGSVPAEVRHRPPFRAPPPGAGSQVGASGASHLAAARQGSRT